MAFDGTEASVVTLQEASEWTANFRATVQPGAVIGHFFGKDVLQRILEQEGCMGIRMYYGIDEDTNLPNLVLVGADANENDMENGVISEKSVCCPPRCGKANKLNSNT